MSKKKNSDTNAKEKFKSYLKGYGFDTDWKSSHNDYPCPADVYAKKGDEEYLFEIKKTAKKNYFGGATYTEWNAALEKYKGHYFFVIAYSREESEDYDFYLISPDNLKPYSVVPPFKIYFNINSEVNDEKGGERLFLSRLERKKTSVAFDDEAYAILCEAWHKLKKLTENTSMKALPKGITSNMDFQNDFMKISLKKDILEQIHYYNDLQLAK